MKGAQLLGVLLVLMLVGVDAFTTNQQDRHQATFQSPVKENGAEKNPTGDNLASHSGATGPLFALPSPAAYAAALPQPYIEEEEQDVSYGVALVSCMFSLALGFGLGYGT